MSDKTSEQAHNGQSGQNTNSAQNTQCAQNSQSPQNASGEKQEVKAKADQTGAKKQYKKPELRKYSQIDYVTAYGVD